MIIECCFCSSNIVCEINVVRVITLPKLQVIDEPIRIYLALTISTIHQLRLETGIFGTETQIKNGWWNLSQLTLFNVSFIYVTFLLRK